ncbi:chitin synthase I [Candida pseudojiufengensis]|uniref:chitin synthase I n=1 Tax=Candida pseudojiufengensis TaxID=497109 RepID=UPI002223F3CD|nr:chitin synthase I [Candida pseudojiufengensis]KAI5968166.1 CHS2 [Candida pseudojiufengensis]
MSYQRPNDDDFDHLHPSRYNNNNTRRYRDQSSEEEDDDSLNFIDHNTSHTPLTHGIYQNIPNNSMNFQQPEPIYHHNQSTTSLHGDNYYSQPIFDTSNIHQQNSNGSDPFNHGENYEMQYQGYNNNYNQAFVPHVYDDEDSEEREFDQRIQYNQFEGDHYDLATASYIDDDQQPSEFVPIEGDIMEEEEEGPFGNEALEYQEPPPQEELRSKKPIRASGINGHLVLDCPVAGELLSKFPDYKTNEKDGGLSREFAFMRYTAVTCGPSNFYRDAYILRPVHYPIPRQTELMIVITMYNEDDILLGRTLKGVFKNIKYLESKSRSSVWGKDSWKKIVVCIVSDGRTKINERAQALLAGLGVYQEGLAKSRVDDKKVQAHMYEYTTRVGISSVNDDVVKLTTEKIVPVQMLFCLKENNAKKINSHRWCFQAIGQVLDPKIVILLDCGTQPSGKSLYKLWKEFDRDHRVAGACGEITASLKKRQMITNPLVYGQNFEYKISNILDKPTESAFGFISVLPGAFSAYRNIALQNDINGRGPLEKYFKGEFLHSSGELDPLDDEYELKRALLKEEAGIFTSNMYLAEDRILCFELVAKRGCNWLLRYCKSASAETDVPEGLAEFILQRRRWLNGSFFAAIYSLVHFPKIWKSSHSLGRKFCFHIEFFYQFINLIVSWFSIGSYFLVFRILTTSLSDNDLSFAPGNILSVVFLWLYLASIVTTFVLSFGNKPKGTEKFYIVIVVFFAILMAYMIFAAIFLAVHAITAIYRANDFSADLFFKNSQFRDLIVATSSTYALYFLASFLYFEPWHMFTSFVQYILLSPSYINVLNIYAFCNIDDVSWGTKGDVGGKSLGEAKLREDGTFDVSVPILKEEINQSYLNQLEKIRDPAPAPEKVLVKNTEDYYAFIRSMTVLTWMFSNFVIIALVLETGGFNQFNRADQTEAEVRSSRSEVFLTVILWTVAFMALFRFIGCIYYLLSRIGRRMRGSEHATKM